MSDVPPPEIVKRFPEGYPREKDSVLQRFIDAPQVQFDELTAEINQTLRSLQLQNATGRGLDLIGWSKGPLGTRENRGDDEYRQFLLALPKSFEGYHRKKDIKKAIASGILSEDIDDIEIPEDVENNTYSVTLHTWQPHPVSLVDFLCQYADEAGVERTGPIRYDWGETSSLDPISDAGIFERTDFGSAGDLEPIPDYSTRVEYEDGFGGFDFDEGYRFDVDEPRDLSFDDVPSDGEETVPNELTLSANSPFYIGGDLHIKGSLRVTQTLKRGFPEFVSFDRYEIRSSPFGESEELEVNGELEVVG